MGFLDLMGSVAKGVGSAVKQKAEEMQAEYDKAYNYGQRASDEKLKKSFERSSSLPTKKGYADVLVERGMLRKDSEGKYHKTSLYY